MLKVRKFHDATIEIDGEEVKLKIARFTIGQMAEFEARFMLHGTRKKDGETPEEFAQREADSQAWIEEVFGKYLAVAPGQIWDEDEQREVTTGTDLLRVYGARTEFVAEALATIYMSNRMSEEQKNALRSRLASPHSSSEPDPIPNGAEPASIATAAEPKASAASEDATVPSTKAGPLSPETLH